MSRFGLDRCVRTNIHNLFLLVCVCLITRGAGEEPYCALKDPEHSDSLVTLPVETWRSRTSLTGNKSCLRCWDPPAKKPLLFATGSTRGTGLRLGLRLGSWGGLVVVGIWAVCEACILLSRCHLFCQSTVFHGLLLEEEKYPVQRDRSIAETRL